MWITRGRADRSDLRSGVRGADRFSSTGSRDPWVRGGRFLRETRGSDRLPKYTAQGVAGGCGVCTEGLPEEPDFEEDDDEPGAQIASPRRDLAIRGVGGGGFTGSEE